MTFNLENKRLLVMGGTRISCEIIRTAKRLGCFVGVADYYPVSMSPGKQIADVAYQVSTLDTVGMTELIRSEKMDGIITGFSDMLLPYYAEICENCGLPCYGTRQQFELFSQKDLYKSLLREFGIPTVEEYYVDPEHFEECAQDIRYPVLVKPADGSGARGITVCDSAVQLKAAFEKAKRFSKSGKILVERYISGREVTVTWLFMNGKAFLTSIGNRHVKNNQKDVIPLPVGYTYPSRLLPKYRKEIEEKCKKMFRSVGIRNGIMFMQCKVENDVCIVYDIGFRLTGTLEYKNIRATCGYDPLEMMISFALTGSMGDQEISAQIDPAFGGNFGFNVSTLSAPGTICEILGIEEVKKFSGIIDSVPAHVPGETIAEEIKGHLAQITVRTLGTVNRAEELYPVMKQIEETISVISSEGKRLNLPGIEPGDVEGQLLRETK